MSKRYIIPAAIRGRYAGGGKKDNTAFGSSP